MYIYCISLVNKKYANFIALRLIVLQLKLHWDFNLKGSFSLEFYGISRDPETKEFIVVIQHANQGNLRNMIKFKHQKLSWKDKLELLYNLSNNLKGLNDLGYCHHKFVSKLIVIDES